jgi:hypothetical protein
MSYADIALKTGITFNKVRDYIENMNDYDSVVKIEKIMTALDLFNFDDKKINKLVKNELKKIGKNNEFIY